MENQRVQNVLLLIVILFLGSCQNSTESTKNSTSSEGYPPAEGFNVEQSDAKAILIADQVMEAQGGYKNWQNTKYIQWTFFGKRILLWDKQTGDVRIEMSEDLQNTIILNIHTGKGKAEKNGVEVTDTTELQTLLNRGKSVWINDSYWLVMPYKLKDSGVSLKYLGEDKVDESIVDVLQLTFENIGDTPQNKYHVYVDQESHLVSRWAFFPKFDDDEARLITPWADYKQYGNILLSGNRGDLALSDIAVLEEVSSETFEVL